MSQQRDDGMPECIEDVTAYPQGCVVEVEVGGHTFRLRADVARGLMIDIGWSLGELLSEETVSPTDPRRGSVIGN